MDNYYCDSCNKSFKLRKNFLRHKNGHKSDTVKILKCDTCGYSTTRSDTLKRHLMVHRAGSKKALSKCCVLCEFKCYRCSELLLHYKSVHEIEIPSAESLHFKDITEFNKWKLSIEKSEKNQYVKNGGTRTLADGSSKLTYVCFRNGYFKPKGSNIRHVKVLGSNKINGYCPAKIVVFIDLSGNVKVEFLKTHVGHKNEVGRLKLSKQEREDIAKSISLQIPFKDILESFRSSFSSDEVDRRSLLTRKDLHNIARDCNLQAKDMRYCNNSTTMHSRLKKKKIKESENLYSAIRQRHVSSDNLSMSEIVQNEADTWKIFSSNRNEMYEVKKVLDSCDCDLKCDDCKICIHAYICTCPDSSIKLNMCEHVHFIIKRTASEKVYPENDVENTEENVLYVNEDSINCNVQRTVINEQILNELQNKNNPEDSNNQEMKKTMIKNRLLRLLAEANTDEELDILDKLVRQGEVTIQEHKSQKV